MASDLVRFIVCYDIMDARRLRVVFRLCTGFGRHVQYSIFMCDLTKRGRIELERDLMAAINVREDRVMIARLGQLGQQTADKLVMLGRADEISDEPDIVIV